MAVTRQEALNDALERLQEIGFTHEPNFAEHGPMAVDALSAMGRNDEVRSWVEAYKARYRHFPPPARQAPIDEADEAGWRGALGTYSRTTDWHDFFNRALAEQPWRDVVSIWAPRLIPGYAGALTHGLIRTTHAVRGIAEATAPTRPQHDELARGLAYWAGSYHAVGGEPTPDAAPRTDREAAALALNRHAAAMAQGLYANLDLAIVPVIQLLHTVTSTVAMKRLLPYLPADFAGEAVGTVRRVSGTIAGRVPGAKAATPRDFGPLPGAADLIERAARHRDEHVIKLTEACLGEDAFQSAPIFRALPQRVAEKIPAWSRP
jgi:hypothetical protein